LIRVAVIGAGRMGRLVIGEVLDAPDLELVAAFTAPGTPELGADAGELVGRGPRGVRVTTLDGGPIDADVAVDFSHPSGVASAVAQLGATPLVSGTTGLDDVAAAALDRHAARAPVLHAANFSTGVNVLLDLVARAARALPDYDVEIVESHHRHKRDAPSGTALALGRAAADARGRRLEELAVHGRSGDTGERPVGQIGLHALRLGDVAGEHEVFLAGPGERVALAHLATSRATFAQGALRGARWLVGRPPGRYDMRDVLGLGA